MSENFLEETQIENEIIGWFYITGTISNIQKYTKTHVINIGDSTSSRIETIVEFIIDQENGQEKRTSLSDVDLTIREGQKASLIYANVTTSSSRRVIRAKQTDASTNVTRWIMLVNHDTRQLTWLADKEIFQKIGIYPLTGVQVRNAILVCFGVLFLFFLSLSSTFNINNWILLVMTSIILICIVGMVAVGCTYKSQSSRLKKTWRRVEPIILNGARRLLENECLK